MKRFTETDKWRDHWFRSLSAQAKLLWGYLTDNCDKIGLFELNLNIASQDCGIKIEQSHMAELSDRVQWVSKTRVFIPKFIRFQYGELKSACPPHRTIIKLVEEHGLVRVGLDYAYPATEKVESKPVAAIPKPIKVKKTVERNLLLDTLASVGGRDIEQMTPSAWGGVAKALSDIKAVFPSVTPDEIARRANNYERSWIGIELTPHSLAKYWDKFDTAKIQTNGRVQNVDHNKLQENLTINPQNIA